MKKNIILFVFIIAFGTSKSFGQTPATFPPPNTEENKVADFKILTPEEAQKVEMERQKKEAEAQRLAKIQETKDKKAAEKMVKKSKRGTKVFLSIVGVAIAGTLVYTWGISNYLW